MSFLGGGGRSLDGSELDTGARREHVELRRSGRETRLGVGTLACPRCDAPVATGGRALTLTDGLDCPFCAHGAPARDFLSLAPPSRPARVIVHVHAPPSR